MKESFSSQPTDNQEKLRPHTSFGGPLVRAAALALSLAGATALAVESAQAGWFSSEPAASEEVEVGNQQKVEQAVKESYERGNQKYEVKLLGSDANSRYPDKVFTVYVDVINPKNGRIAHFRNLEVQDLSGEFKTRASDLAVDSQGWSHDSVPSLDAQITYEGIGFLRKP